VPADEKTAALVPATNLAIWLSWSLVRDSLFTFKPLVNLILFSILLVFMVIESGL
jgi:hypothetical protein